MKRSAYIDVVRDMSYDETDLRPSNIALALVLSFVATVLALVLDFRLWSST